MKANTGPQETLVLDREDLPEVGIDAANVEFAFKPIQDRYLVRLDSPMDRSRGGILVPDQSVPQSRSGVVVQAGLGALTEDNRTRTTMHARVGDRVLFEYAAGYSIPRVPDQTTTRERGYRVIRDGSIIAVIVGRGKWPEFPEAPEDVIPRLQLVQDWLLVRNDRPQALHRLAMPRRALTPAERAGKRVKDNKAPISVSLPPQLRGRVLVLPSAGSQVALADRWTGTVVARGPGLMVIIRCLDGDRVAVADKLCQVGSRIMYSTPEFPLMSLPGVDGHALVSERHCLAGILAP